MIARRLIIACFGVCLAAVASVGSAVSATYAAAASAAGRFVDFVFRTLADPFWLPPSYDRAATDGPALAYDGPPLHELRHEAGVSRRSAARNT